MNALRREFVELAREVGNRDDELVEHRRRVGEHESGVRTGPARVAGEREVDLGEPPDARLPEQREPDRDAKRAQALIRADVARRLLAPDVLLACGQRHHERALARRVDALADQAAGELAHEFLARGEEARVRTAEGQGQAERLCLAAGDVAAELSG